jgi:UrcA family protein
LSQAAAAAPQENTMKLTIIAAAVVLAGAPALAQAQSYRVLVRGDVETRSVDVFLGDLNLSDPRAVREASRRIDSAARYVCQSRPGFHDLADHGDYRQCRYVAFDDAWHDLEEQAGGPIGQGRVITRERVPSY